VNQTHPDYREEDFDEADFIPVHEGDPVDCFVWGFLVGVVAGATIAVLVFKHALRF